MIDISIHAPREGGDGTAGKIKNDNMISIHAPREGGDRVLSVVPQSGSSFNPRPPRGGRPKELCLNLTEMCISIHAPREGGDSKDAQFYLRIFDK